MSPASHHEPPEPPEPPGAPSLEVSGLAYAYPDGTQALFGVDVTIGRGERVALLGPNGAGKTTLVLHLNGILHGGAGTVRVGGLTVDSHDRASLREIRRRVGIVFQDPDDQLFMPTVREDVAFGPANLGLRGARLRERVERSLAQVGMLEVADRPPQHLSFGQRRRVAVATVLAMEPEILVLDEPSSNLDPAGRRELAEILLGLDVTMLMVTHDLPYAAELCERSLILSGGVIAADGPTLGLLADTELLHAHRLELPYGFDPAVAAAQAAGAALGRDAAARDTATRDAAARDVATQNAAPGGAAATRVAAAESGAADVAAGSSTVATGPVHGSAVPLEGGDH